MKNYNKDNEPSYIQYLDANIYGWAMPQKLSVDGFEWVEDISSLDKKNLKNL